MGTIRLFFITILLSTTAFAEIPSKSNTHAEFLRSLEVNKTLQDRSRVAPATTGQPVLETDHFRYLLLNGTDIGVDNLAQLQKTFALNLPQDMILVVVTESSNAKSIKEKYLQWISQDRLIVASGKNLGDTVWGRDSYPYPVYQDESKTVELVAHEYFRYFAAHDIIANAVNANNVTKPGFISVGGNLMGTAKGECFIVDSTRTFGLEDKMYKSAFRCKSVMRFPWVAGIGDVDEVIKVLPNNVVLTNQDSYVADLEKLGYKVTMLPKPTTGDYRTYANSVILNDTVFMPIYNDANDDDATRVYESFGYKVIGIESNYLSDKMNGSVHCLTMTYPNMDSQDLMKKLGLTQH